MERKGDGDYVKACTRLVNRLCEGVYQLGWWGGEGACRQAEEDLAEHPTAADR